jgi:hypothetical protein
VWEHEVMADPVGVGRRIGDVLLNVSRTPVPSWRVTCVVPLDQEGKWERRTLVNLDVPLRRRTERHRRHTRKWKAAIASRYSEL